MSGIGTLVVQVYTSKARIPVEGAAVLVTCQNQEGAEELVTLQTTDASGFTKPILLATPVRGESTSPLPSGSDEIPYTTCSVWAEHEGFLSMHIEGVQIFPGIQTLQEMKLVPLGCGADCTQEWDTQEISPQGL